MLSFLEQEKRWEPINLQSFTLQKEKRIYQGSQIPRQTGSLTCHVTSSYCFVSPDEGDSCSCKTIRQKMYVTVISRAFYTSPPSLDRQLDALNAFHKEEMMNPSPCKRNWILLSMNPWIFFYFSQHQPPSSQPQPQVGRRLRKRKGRWDHTQLSLSFLDLILFRKMLMAMIREIMMNIVNNRHSILMIIRHGYLPQFSLIPVGHAIFHSFHSLMIFLSWLFCWDFL